MYLVRPIQTPRNSIRILTATDYFTRRTEEISLKNVNDNEFIQFLQRNIITRFRVPNNVIFYNATYFSSLKVVQFSLKHNINMRYSTNYYPQGNGVVESINKKLLRIIKNIVVEHQRDRNNALDTSLWASRVSPRISLRTSCYFLIHVKEAILPQIFI